MYTILNLHEKHFCLASSSLSAAHDDKASPSTPLFYPGNERQIYCPSLHRVLQRPPPSPTKDDERGERQKRWRRRGLILLPSSQQEPCKRKQGREFLSPSRLFNKVLSMFYVYYRHCSINNGLLYTQRNKLLHKKWQQWHS